MRKYLAPKNKSRRARTQIATMLRDCADQLDREGDLWDSEQSTQGPEDADPLLLITGSPFKGPHLRLPDEPPEGN